MHALELTNQDGWRAYCRSSKKPDDIPKTPAQVYRAEWRGVGDWLGTGTVATHNRSYRPFVEARAFVQALGLKGVADWVAYCRSGKQPNDIPKKPQQVYRAEWRGFGDWLGTGTVATFDRSYRPFAEARAFVHALELKNNDEWRDYCRSGKKPDDIPANPDRFTAPSGEAGVIGWAPARSRPRTARTDPSLRRGRSCTHWN